MPGVQIFMMPVLPSNMIADSASPYERISAVPASWPLVRCSFCSSTQTVPTLPHSSLRRGQTSRLTVTRAVLVASLRAQLDPAHATGKNSAMLHFNLERVINKTRCQAAAWVPGTQGGAFVAAHFDGQFYIYHKACCSHVANTRLDASTCLLVTVHIEFRNKVIVFKESAANTGPRHAVPVGCCLT